MKVLARERMTESKDELARMLGEDELRDAVLLVSQINTQDYHDSGTICAHVIGAQIKALATYLRPKFAIHFLLSPHRCWQTSRTCHKPWVLQRWPRSWVCQGWVDVSGTFRWDSPKVGNIFRDMFASSLESLTVFVDRRPARQQGKVWSRGWSGLVASSRMWSSRRFKKAGDFFQSPRKKTIKASSSQWW